MPPVGIKDCAVLLGFSAAVHGQRRSDCAVADHCSHTIDESCEAVSHGCDGLGGTQFGAQTAVLGSQVAAAADQIPGGQPQCCGGAIDHVSCAFAQQLVTADAVVRTEP